MNRFKVHSTEEQYKAWKVARTGILTVCIALLLTTTYMGLFKLVLGLFIIYRISTWYMKRRILENRFLKQTFVRTLLVCLITWIILHIIYEFLYITLVLLPVSIAQ